MLPTKKDILKLIKAQFFLGCFIIILLTSCTLQKTSLSSNTTKAATSATTMLTSPSTSTTKTIITYAHPDFEIVDGVITKLNNYDIKDFIIPGDLGIAEIGDTAFVSCLNLESVVIPKGLYKVGGGAFANCIYLKTVSLGTDVKRIEEAAFSGCENLSEITIPKSVIFIGNNAFENCKHLVIHGEKESIAEKYAQSFGIKFISIK